MINNVLYNEDVVKLASDNSLSFEKLKNKKILITGATGLICSFLIDALMYRNEHFKDNIKIFIVSRNEEKVLNKFKEYKPERFGTNKDSNLIYIIQNVCDPLNCDVDFDYIIHAASNTHPMQYSTDPVGTITANIIGFYNLLNYSINHNIGRILLLSSVEIYGENKGDIDKFDENYLGYINCNTVRAGYPEAKRICESLCQAYISQYNLDIVIGRLSRVYGPTMQKDDSKALSQFIKKAINEEDIVLKSEGNQLYSYLYVLDAVSAMLKIIIDGKVGEAYNIADDASNITLKDLAHILAKINDKQVIFEVPSDVEKRGYSTATKAILDSTKLKNIGWHAIYDIEKGINRTVKILKKEN